MNKNRHSYAFVLPRFGEGIVGGAETLAGSLARKLAERGDQVEVFTTCAKDNRSWANEYPAESSTAFDVPVHRFLVDNRDIDIWIPLQIRIAEGLRLTVDEQLEWMSQGVNSRSMYGALLERAGKFDAIFFAPYLFATTFWGSQLVPERSFLIPCLHDEVYAYQEIIACMFSQVRGAIFNALPEMELARSLYGEIPGGEVGMGFESYPIEHIEAIAPYFKEDFPYLLYLGRKETGKNVQMLIDFFCESKNSPSFPQEMKLVIVGGGDFADLHRESVRERDDIVDLSHLSEVEKESILRHAVALVQPSVNESFSIVLMESWRLSTPVIVHGACSVTRHHVEHSGGGLFFESSAEFREVVSLLNGNRTIRNQVSSAGRRYVESVYSWQAVLDRFDTVMDQFLSPEKVLHR